MIEELNIRLAAEDFDDVEFKKLHFFTHSDEQVLRRLIVAGPVLLRGPRGSGKSAFMKSAHMKMKNEDSNIFSAYFSLRHFPLLTAKADNYLLILVPFISNLLQKELSEQNLNCEINFKSITNTDELKSALTELSVVLHRRIVLMFDDVAHIGRETSLAGFFDFFRTLSSSVVSCKAAIYPGVTKFGSRFDFYSDATIIEAQRDERSSDFAEFFEKILNSRHPGLLDKTDSKLKEILATFLGRAVLGNVRAFNSLCSELDKHPNITVIIVGDTLKWLSSDYLYPALEELSTKLGAYTPMLKIAESIAPIIFKDCGKQKVNAILVQREHLKRIGKVFEILEYTGFIAKREASRSLSKSGSGRGPRYAISLGPLFEKIHGVTLSYDLMDSLLRISVPNEELVEYSATSELQEFTSPVPDEDIPIDVLSLPVSKLEVSKLMPYGLTQLMITSLKNGGYETVEDVVKVSVEELKLLEGIWDSKARRIRNAVEQAIWM